jgi:tRNA(fMet)-specific endonuclease VapC
MSYLLDTNIITAILKQDARLSNKLYELRFQPNHQLFISCVTYFESEGGLLGINAQKKLRMLETLCKSSIQILFLDNMDIIHIASRIYADLKIKGTPIQAPDIMIAATAIYHNLILVSNDSDLQRVAGLMLENWLA